MPKRRLTHRVPGELADDDAAWEAFEQGIAASWEAFKHEAAPQCSAEEWQQLEHHVWQGMRQRLQWKRELEVKRRQEQAHIEQLRSLEKTYEAFQQWLVMNPVSQPPSQPAPAEPRAKARDTSQVLTAAEAAALLRIDRNALYKLRLPEALPHRPGGKHRYLKSAVLRYMEEQANGKAG